MTFTVQPVRVASEEGDGLLVMNDGALVAVLVRLSDLHEDQAGMWYLEAGIGPLHDLAHGLVIEDLQTALDYIRDQVTSA